MILITGATGLLGGHLIRYVLQDNEHVVALKRVNSDIENIKFIFKFYEDDEDELFRRILWREGDIEDFESLLHAFEGVNYVYHCAAMVDLGKNNQRMLDINAGGTRNIVDACLERKVKKLCFVSSIAALKNGNNPIDEVSIFSKNDQTSLYGESKRLAEDVIKKGISKGLNAVIVNPGVIIGYSKNMTGSSELFKRVRAGLPFYTKGITGYINVQDVAKVMILLIKSSMIDEKFVVVSENKSHKDVLQKIADGYGKYRPFIGMGKSLILVAYVLELLGRIFHFIPLIDSVSARSSISRKEYTSQKLLTAFPDFRFSSIDETIKRVCEFDRENSDNR